MKRFRFRLEAVLSLRALAERSARERLGAAQGRLALALDALRLAETRRASLVEALAETRRGVFRPAEQAGSMVALTVADDVVASAARTRAEAAAATDLAREQWLVARRRLQVVERLRERARAAHREAAEKAEQALLDELASIAAARLSRSAL